MRIISGNAKRRQLKNINGKSIRPTTDRVKETIFNIIAPDIPDAIVLDLFAGSGNLGLEAKSRGARSVTFVDKSNYSIRIIKENIAITDLRGNIISQDAIEFIKSTQEAFDIIFADPPYKQGYVNKLLKALEANSTIVKKDGIFILEHHINEPIQCSSDYFGIWREKEFGETIVTFIARL